MPRFSIDKQVHRSGRRTRQHTGRLFSPHELIVKYGHPYCRANAKILLSNCRFYGSWDEFEAEGFGALLEIAHRAFFLLALIVVLACVTVFRAIL